MICIKNEILRNKKIPVLNIQKYTTRDRRAESVKPRPSKAKKMGRWSVFKWLDDEEKIHQLTQQMQTRDEENYKLKNMLHKREQEELFPWKQGLVEQLQEFASTKRNRIQKAIERARKKIWAITRGGSCPWAARLQPYPKFWAKAQFFNFP